MVIIGTKYEKAAKYHVFHRKNVYFCTKIIENMEIERLITSQLKAWKENPRRKPLVLQGARQVGKSWVMKQFGKECFHWSANWVPNNSTGHRAIWQNWNSSSN